MVDTNFVKASLFHKRDGKLVLNNPDFEEHEDRFVMNKARYNTEVRKDGLISYSHPDLDIAFRYIGFKFDNRPFDSSKESVVPTLKTKRDVEFKGVNTAVDLDVITDNTVWTKQITINKNINIPKGAKYIELHFGIVSNVPLPTEEIDCAFKIGEVEIKEPMVWSDKIETIVDDEGEEREANWSRNISYTIKDGVLIKKIPVEFLEDLPIYSDIIIALDTAITFESGSSAWISICSMSATHFVVAFQDVDDGTKGKVIAGSLAGTVITITADTATTFESDKASYISVCSMDATHFVIAFTDEGDADKGKVIAGSLAGVAITITADTATTFESGFTTYNKICSMSATHFVIAIRDAGDFNRGKVIAGSLAGVAITITADTATTFESGNTTYIAICSMSATHFVVAFTDGGDAFHGKVIAGSLAGVAITITADTGTAFESSASSRSSICSMSATHFVVAFRDSTDGSKGKVIAGSLAGVAITITADSATTYETGATDSVSVCSMDATHFVIAFRDTTDSNKGKVIDGSLAGVTITLTDLGTTFESGNSVYNEVCSMDDTYFVIAITDVGDGSKGKVIAGTNEEAPPPLTAFASVTSKLIAAGII